MLSEQLMSVIFFTVFFYLLSSGVHCIIATLCFEILQEEIFSFI